MNDHKEISESDGVKLVKMARAVVTEYLSSGKKLEITNEFESNFSFKSGVFVTLNNTNGLRGCIGYPLPDKKLYNAIVDASIAAATEDPRFPSVKAEELDDITFEVTVLTPPVEIQVSDPLEYPSKIKIGRDGLIVKHSLYSGLLLPQVPLDYGWTEEEFLAHTCEKAGLPRDIWKNKETKIQRFEGIIYKEERPKGRVVREYLKTN